MAAGGWDMIVVLSVITFAPTLTTSTFPELSRAAGPVWERGGLFWACIVFCSWSYTMPLNRNAGFLSGSGPHMDGWDPWTVKLKIKTAQCYCLLAEHTTTTKRGGGGHTDDGGWLVKSFFHSLNILFHLKWPYMGLKSFWFLENDGFWQEGS